MRRLVAHELIDDPAVDRRELMISLRNIEAANRRFGGHGVVLQELERLRRAGRAPNRLVDVGAGFGDLGEVVVRWGNRRGLALQMVCVDNHPTMLALALERRGHVAGLTFVQGDGRRLEVPDASFDVALCTLTLHHLEPSDAVAMLRELRRVSRVTPVVADLVRAPVALALVWLWSRVIARDRLSRHDGPLSVRRAYTPHEALALAREAGWRAPRARVAGGLRLVLTDGFRNSSAHP